jgi:hypothetical protein
MVAVDLGTVPLGHLRVIARIARIAVKRRTP